MKGLLTTILTFAVATGCVRTDAVESEARARRNLERLTRFELNLLAGSHVAGFVEVPPFPPGRPWEKPHRLSENQFALETDSRGALHEQYEIRIDPKGIKAATLTQFVVSDGGDFRKVSENSDYVPGWCEIVARGKFGRRGVIVELTKRLWISGQEAKEGEVIVR